MENLLDFFGFKDEPFRLTPDPLFFFPSMVHKEALDSLDYIVKEREGFCVVTGEPGTGKTTLINVFQDMWKNKAEIALILTSRLSPDEFLLTILEDLKVPLKEKNKNEVLKVFRDFLIDKYIHNKYVIIIVDEAQNVPDDTLEELRLLSNLETEKEKLLQIVLIGQPELEDRLNKDKLRQLDQRITERIRLRQLTGNETLDYINHRLAKAGKAYMKLDKKVVHPIYQFSGGVPRIINLIASRSIMSAYIDGSSAIKSKHVRYAVDYFKSQRFKRKIPLKLLCTSTACALGLLMLSVFAYVMFQPVKDTASNSASVIWGFRNIFGLTDTTSEEIISDKNQREATQGLQNQLTESPPAKGHMLGWRQAKQEKRLLKENRQKASGIFEKNQTGKGKKWAVVNVLAANVRVGPRIDAPRLAVIYDGMHIETLADAVDQNGSTWYKIFESQNAEGWISEQVVTLIDRDG